MKITTNSIFKAVILLVMIIMIKGTHLIHQVMLRQVQMSLHPLEELPLQPLSNPQVHLIAIQPTVSQTTTTIVLKREYRLLVESWRVQSSRITKALLHRSRTPIISNSSINRSFYSLSWWGRMASNNINSNLFQGWILCSPSLLTSLSKIRIRSFFQERRNRKMELVRLQ